MGDEGLAGFKSYILLCTPLFASFLLIDSALLQGLDPTARLAG